MTLRSVLYQTTGSEADRSQDGNDNVTLELGSHGRIYAKSQVTDYMLRGEDIEGYNLFEFIRDTYETDLSPSERAEEPEQVDDSARRPGRPKHQRSRYLPAHPCHQSKHRVVRGQGHKTLVNIVGRWFPRDDDPEVRDFYCACMLVLLKPWRVLQRDLKQPGQTWDAAFAAFMVAASPAMLYVVDGVRYFHQCALAADADRADEDAADSAAGRRHRDEQVDDDDNDTPIDHTMENGLPVYTPEALAALKAAQTSYAEKAHAVHAVAMAKRAGYFSDVVDAPWSPSGAKIVGAATGDDLVKLQSWRAQLATDVAAQQQGLAGASPTGDDPGPDVVLGVNPASAAAAVLHVPEPDAEAALPAVDISSLRPDQFRAFDIVLWHLDMTLSGAAVPPLRMVLYGEGGTGKSRVIQTITQAFAARGCAHLLVKAAYTGIAASLIDGKTTHVIGHIRVASKDKNALSDNAKKLLQAIWQGKKYLILDEFSMLAKTFFALLSRNLSVGMQGNDTDMSRSFGGLSVILCGDLHQFPPVACAAGEALYKPTNLTRDAKHADRILGRTIYEEFTTVVVLREQMRVSDPTWREFLVHLRHGKVTNEDLKMLRTLIMKPNSDTTAADMSSPIWQGASLVTPRHAVRMDWNAEGVRKWCRAQKERLYIITAEDRVKKCPLTLPEQCAVAGRTHGEKGRKRKNLPETLEVAIGMQVMVTSNIQTDLDLANGARGEVVDLVLHPDEPPVGDGCVVHLQHLPAYILVKMHRTRAAQLDELEVGVVPVEPMESRMKIELTVPGQPALNRTVVRRQFPITAAYAFTDYRSQGQTIPAVIVDIMSPPGPQKLSLFNLYVALSRSSGRDTIRLQRDFEDTVFMQQHDPDLLKEDEKLDKDDRDTQAWWMQMRSQASMGVVQNA